MRILGGGVMVTSKDGILKKRVVEKINKKEVGQILLLSVETKKECAPAGNRTQGSSMATMNFTTKPLELILM